MKTLSLVLSLLLAFFIANGQGKPPLKITISSNQDTLYTAVDSFSMNRLYKINDSLIQISIVNTSDSVVEVEDNFNIGYKEDFWTRIYFRSWYSGRNGLTEYSNHWADIDFVGDIREPIQKLKLQPGRKKILYKNPFYIYGYSDTPGLHRLQGVYIADREYFSNHVDIFFAGKDTLTALSTETLLHYASAAFKAGKFYDAAHFYDELLKRDSNNTEWMYQRGLCALAAKKYFNAAAWLGSAAAKDTSNVGYRLKLAEALSADNRYSEAAEEYNRLVTQLSNSDSMQKKLPELIAEANRKQAEADENDIEKILSEASSAKYRKDFRRALALYDKAYKLDSKAFDNYADRGLCKYEIGIYEDALKDINVAITNHLGYGYNYFYRSMVLTALRRYRAACADIDRALQLDKRGYLVEYHKQEIEDIKTLACKH